MSKSLKTLLVAVVAAFVAVSVVALPAAADKGRRLGGPICVDNKGRPPWAGVMRAVTKGQKCRPGEILRYGLFTKRSEITKIIQGAAGPAGPKGDTGPGGPQGPAGSAGAAGSSATISSIPADSADCAGASVYNGSKGVYVSAGGVRLPVCNGLPGTRGDAGSPGAPGAPGSNGGGNDKKKCNAGNGNGPEGKPDCDPGNSAGHNNGRD